MREAIRQYVATPRKATLFPGAFGGGGQRTADELLQQFAAAIVELDAEHQRETQRNPQRNAKLGGGVLGVGQVFDLLSRGKIRFRDFVWRYWPFNKAETECGFWSWIVTVAIVIVLASIAASAWSGVLAPAKAAQTTATATMGTLTRTRGFMVADSALTNLLWQPISTLISKVVPTYYANILATAPLTAFVSSMLTQVGVSHSNLLLPTTLSAMLKWVVGFKLVDFIQSYFNVGACNLKMRPDLRTEEALCAAVQDAQNKLKKAKDSLTETAATITGVEGKVKASENELKVLKEPNHVPKSTASKVDQTKYNNEIARVTTAIKSNKSLLDAAEKQKLDQEKHELQMQAAVDLAVARLNHEKKTCPVVTDLETGPAGASGSAAALQEQLAAANTQAKRKPDREASRDEAREN